jgi:hypothetical protein
MNFQIDFIEKVKNRIKENLEGFNVQQFNYIPKGFNNNLIWHIGHLTSAICRRVFQTSNLDFPIDKNLVEVYKAGTKPEKVLGEQEIATLFVALDKVIDQLKLDYASKKFTAFQPWHNSSGDLIETFEDTISFSLYHIGLHFGYIQALKRNVLQENL